MKELKILAVVVFFTGLIYWGVEPFAHSQMHPELPHPDYAYSDMPAVAVGDVAKGKESVAANCTACHGLEKEGLQPPLGANDAAAAYGVVPPDLSKAGKIYSDKFLAGFLKNPVHATHLEHKFDKEYAGGKFYPMPKYDYMSDEEISNIVTYFKSIAPANMSDKEVFVDACARCHSMKYDKVPAGTPKEPLKAYMGSNPPDLSMMIRSRGEHYLESFINDPQKALPGTSMPRVGLSEDAQKQVISYMEKVGDSKKDERNAIGVNVIIFSIILAVLAFMWKIKIWKELH